MTQNVHHFDESVRRSESAKEHAMWRAAFERAFPGAVSIAQVASGPSQAQKLGIDYVVTLSSGRSQNIDAKARPSWDKRDVALEVEHVHRGSGRSEPGWMEKELQIDYLAYGLVKLHLVYVLPWPMLRRAWLHFREPWIAKAKARRDGFFWSQANNDDRYTSCCCCVPERILLDAVRLASVIDLTRPPPLAEQGDLFKAAPR